MAAYRHREGRGPSKLQFAALALVLTSSQAYADSFQEKWMGRIARPPADDQEASVYWEDKWDARGRVLDFSLGAARQIGCDGLCRVTVRRAGYE